MIIILMGKQQKGAKDIELYIHIKPALSWNRRWFLAHGSRTVPGTSYWPRLEKSSVLSCSWKIILSHIYQKIKWDPSHTRIFYSLFRLLGLDLKILSSSVLHRIGTHHPGILRWSRSLCWRKFVKTAEIGVDCRGKAESSFQRSLRPDLSNPRTRYWCVVSWLKW